MHVDLTDLKSNIAPEVLSSILQRAIKQVKDDAELYQQAIHKADFALAAQLIHRMRGLALFLGVSESELAQVFALENELAARVPGCMETPLSIAVFTAQFDLFRMSFETALLNVSDSKRSC